MAYPTEGMYEAEPWEGFTKVATPSSGQKLRHGDQADFIPGEHDGDMVVL
jgi:hypothetical protein